MNEHDRLVLHQILNHCCEIERRLDSYSITDNSILSDSALLDMVLMPLFQIGELVDAISTEYTSSKKAIPWRAMRGMRNIIAHDYGVVDPLWIWNTVSVDIPVLREFLEDELTD